MRRAASGRGSVDWHGATAPAGYSVAATVLVRTGTPADRASSTAAEVSPLDASRSCTARVVRSIHTCQAVGVDRADHFDTIGHAAEPGPVLDHLRQDG